MIMKKVGTGMTDYEYALYFVIWGMWEDLSKLMLQTEDDLLGKKIERFLQAYYHASDDYSILERHDDLINYLDFACEDITIYSLEILS